MEGIISNQRTSKESANQNKALEENITQGIIKGNIMIVQEIHWHFFKLRKISEKCRKNSIDNILQKLESILKMLFRDRMLNLTRWD